MYNISLRNNVIKRKLKSKQWLPFDLFLSFTNKSLISPKYLTLITPNK